MVSEVKYNKEETVISAKFIVVVRVYGDRRIVGLYSMNVQSIVRSKGDDKVRTFLVTRTGGTQLV